MATNTTFVAKQPVKAGLAGDQVIAVKKLSFVDNPVAAADVVQLVNIQANTLVTRVSVIVVTAQGATCTATVGDASGANSWDASTNLNAAAGTVTSSAEADAYHLTGKFYTAADTIDMTMGHTTDTAVIIVMVWGVHVPEYSA